MSKKALSIILSIVMLFSVIPGALTTEAAAKNTVKTSITKVESKAKGFKVTWKKKSKIKGYQIQYSTSSKFKKSSTKTKTISKAKTKSATISKLKGCNVKYYVRVRTYKTSKGKKIYSSWSKSKKVTTWGHLAPAATCTTPAKCMNCGKILENSLGHDWNAATCTEAKSCKRCKTTSGKTLEHRVVVDKAIEATCDATGLTEGSHCSVCNTVIVAQKSIPSKGHRIVTDSGFSATCTRTGLTGGSHCSVCNTILVAQQLIPSNGHRIVRDSAVAATCTRTGLTEGSHCSVCNTVIVAQKSTSMLAHSYGSAVTVSIATCTSSGQYYYACTKCGYKQYYSTGTTSHNYQNVRVYQAGLGWVYRQQCTVCGRGK